MGLIFGFMIGVKDCIKNPYELSWEKNPLIFDFLWTDFIYEC